MLHPSKSQSILQWFNSMPTKRSIEALTHFSDGLHFYDIVNSIISLRAGKHPDASVNSSDNIVNDSSSSIVCTTKAATDIELAKDEKNAEANSCEIEMSVNEEVLENHKESVTNEEGSVGSSKKARNKTEIKKRYDAVKKFIDDFFNLDSNSLITYSECIKGKELELAKVAVLVLSAMVQSFLSTHSDQLYTTTLLNLQVQEDIKECLGLVLVNTNVEDGSLTRTEFHRILSRPSKSKGTPRKRIPSRGTPQVLETPEASKSVPKKRRNQASTFTEDIIESPLKKLLESPQIQLKAALFKKDTDISKLREALHAEETNVIDLKIEKRRLNVDLEKKKRELEFLKEERQKAQDCADAKEACEKAKMEGALAEKERDSRIIHDLKVEMKEMKNENEKLLAKVDCLEEKLSQKSNADQTDYKQLYGNLLETLKEKELNINFKAGNIQDLKKEVASLEHDLKTYKQMYEEIKKEEISNSETSPKVSETASNIIYFDELSACDKLRQMEENYAELRKCLAIEKENSKNFEKLAKVAESERLNAIQKMRSLQMKLANKEYELDSSQKQIEVYEVWSKTVKNGKNISNTNGKEMASGYPPGSLPTTSSDGSGRENVKEELESARLWDSYSGKSMETRSRSASALGHHKDSLADPSLSCSESEFLHLKKLVCSIVKVLNKKKWDTVEAQRFIQIEEQARCLSSIKDLSEFCHSLLEAVKSVKLGALSSVSELPSKRKCRSQTAEETDSNIIDLLSQNKVLESELKSMKQEFSKLQTEFKIQVEAKACEIKSDEDRSKELENSSKELKDKLVKSKQEATNANMKYEYTKKQLEKINHENKRLVKLCVQLKDDARPKVEPCKECECLHKNVSDLKRKKKDFMREIAELNDLVREMKSKNMNLDQKLKIEAKERKKLEFQMQRESAFLSGTLSQRNAVIHHYFQQGLAESERKCHADKGQKVVSFNTFILNHENKDPCPKKSMSTTFANRSIRSGFLQTDDEEDFLNHSSLQQIQSQVLPEPDGKRLTEIQRRNTLCLPHLQSSYPVELQNLTPTEKKYFDKIPLRKPLEITSEEVTYSEFDGDVSQDVQFPPSIKHKLSEQEKVSAQPLKKPARSSSQVKLIQRVKPITPVRKTGILSKSFKTPTSIRRLMRMPHKNKKQ